MCVKCKKRTNMMPNFTPLLTYNNVHIHTYNYSPKSAWLHGLHFWLSRLLMLWTLETVAPYGATLGWIFIWMSHIIFMNVFRRIFYEEYLSKVLVAFKMWRGQAYVVNVICLYDLQVVKIVVKTWWRLARQLDPILTCQGVLSICFELTL